MYNKIHYLYIYRGHIYAGGCINPLPPPHNTPRIILYILHINIFICIQIYQTPHMLTRIAYLYIYNMYNIQMYIYIDINIYIYIYIYMNSTHATEVDTLIYT